MRSGKRNCVRSEAETPLHMSSFVVVCPGVSLSFGLFLYPVAVVAVPRGYRAKGGGGRRGFHSRQASGGVGRGGSASTARKGRGAAGRGGSPVLVGLVFPSC